MAYEHYFGGATALPRATNTTLRIYAALPANEPTLGARDAEANACVTEGHPGGEQRNDVVGSAKLSACPSAMRLVEGTHCLVVGHRCLEFLSLERDRCRIYHPSSPCVGPSSPQRFCMDEYEFPNHQGTKPMVGVNFREASALCRAQNKRLCNSIEWELACEGPERFPYPYGYVRDSAICNFDRAYIESNDDAYAKQELRDAEISRLDQREASGARPDCVSAYGVFDMTGNVDEWVVHEDGGYEKPPFRSALKGGYWGRVRNRCRPTTTDHNEWHSGYQIGFRCCAEAASPDPANERLALRHLESPRSAL